MSTHNICFYGELTKIVLQLSSNTHFICSLLRAGVELVIHLEAEFRSNVSTWMQYCRLERKISSKQPNVKLMVGAKTFNES